jgi:hypothetical protein
MIKGGEGMVAARLKIAAIVRKIASMNLGVWTPQRR